MLFEVSSFLPFFSEHEDHLSTLGVGRGDLSERVEDRSVGTGLRPGLSERMTRTGSLVQRPLGSLVRGKKGTVSFAYGG